MKYLLLICATLIVSNCGYKGKLQTPAEAERTEQKKEERLKKLEERERREGTE